MFPVSALGSVGLGDGSLLDGSFVRVVLRFTD